MMAFTMAGSLSSSMTHAVEMKPTVLIPKTVKVPAGAFIMGSHRDEREMAYRLDEAAYGHNNTLKWKWYENEAHRSVTTAAYAITTNLISNAQYAVFVREAGHRVPNVDRKTWSGYRLIHPFARTRRHAWIDGTVPQGRAQHPVVMVSYPDALAYADWLTKKNRVSMAVTDGSRMGESRPGGQRSAVSLGEHL